MMRTRVSDSLRAGAVVALLLVFAGWCGLSFFHDHPTDPTCQVCKLLHAGAADLVDPVAGPPTAAVVAWVRPERGAPAVAHTRATPPGRAPPRA